MSIKYNTLYILYGNIASGKSTFCKKLAEKGAIVVNDDAVVQAVHGGNYKLYDKKNKPLYKAIEHEILTKSLLFGKDVIIDRPNTKIKTRQRYNHLARSYKAQVVLVCFQWENPAVHAQRRFDSDSRGHTYEHWLKVAEFKNAVRQDISHIEKYDRVIRYEYKNRETYA